MSNEIPFKIQTKSGRRLWQYLNDSYGSSVWGPVGRGIEEIEAEMREIILNEAIDKQESQE